MKPASVEAACRACGSEESAAAPGVSGTKKGEAVAGALPRTPRIGPSITVCGVMLLGIALTTGVGAATSWQRSGMAEAEMREQVLARALALAGDRTGGTEQTASQPSRTSDARAVAFFASDGRIVDLTGGGSELPRVIKPLISMPASESESRVVKQMPLPGEDRRHLVALRSRAGTPPADGVLAIVVDGVPRPKSTGRLTAIGVGLAGLIASGLWLRYTIVRPINVLSRSMSVEADIRAMPAIESVPDELALLSDFFEKTRCELNRWKLEANTLRQTLEHRVTKRTESVERALRQAERAADTDVLSGLGNRRLLEKAYGELRVKSDAEGTDFCVALIDINEFKYVNDTLGHARGDDLIELTGTLLRSTLRSGVDVPLRLGGDEFVILMPGMQPEQASGVIQRTAAMFAQATVSFESNGTKPSLSAGIACYRSKSGRTCEQIVAEADKAMYAAKQKHSAVQLARR